MDSGSTETRFEFQNMDLDFDRCRMQLQQNLGTAINVYITPDSQISLQSYSLTYFILPLTCSCISHLLSMDKLSHFAWPELFGHICLRGSRVTSRSRKSQHACAKHRDVEAQKEILDSFGPISLK